MRPGIGADELQAIGHPALDLALQTIVMSGAIVLVQCNAQPTVRGDTRTAVEELISGSELRRRISDAVKQMILFRAHPGHGQHRLFVQLPLHAHRVLLQHRVLVVFGIRDRRHVRRVRFVHGEVRRRQQSRRVGIQIVGRSLDWKILSRERNTITLVRGIRRCAVEIRIVRQLVADSAAIPEIVDPVTPAQRCLAVAEDVISESNTRANIAPVGVDQAARVAADAGHEQRAARDVEIRLPIVFFVRPGENVVA